MADDCTGTDATADDQSDVLIAGNRVRIPYAEFSFSFMRSSGPGGQNVNKVNSKVRLCWDVTKTTTLPDDVLQRFLSAYKSRINSEGVFQVTSQRYRDQPKNREDCLEKLRGLLLKVETAPKPRKLKKPSRAAKRKRLDQKKKQSGKKQSRRKPHMDD